MSWKRLVLCGVLLIVTATSGCCRICDRWCGQRGGGYNNGYGPPPAPAPIAPAQGGYCVPCMPCCPTNAGSSPAARGQSPVRPVPVMQQGYNSGWQRNYNSGYPCGCN